MATGIENLQRLRKALRHAEKTKNLIKDMTEAGAQSQQVLDAQRHADALVKHLQMSLADIDVTVKNRLNS